MPRKNLPEAAALLLTATKHLEHAGTALFKLNPMSKYCSQTTKSELQEIKQDDEAHKLFNEVRGLEKRTREVLAKLNDLHQHQRTDTA